MRHAAPMFIKACLYMSLGLFAFASAQQSDNPNETIVDSVVATIKIPVTYRDYHGDCSNPEFQCPRNDFIQPDRTILDTLDEDRKPIPNPDLVGVKTVIDTFIDLAAGDTTITERTDTLEFMDYGYHNLGNWWRDWAPGDTYTYILPADTVIRYYIDSATGDTIVNFWGDTVISYGFYADTLLVEPDTVISDTLFKSVTVEDSLIMYKMPYKLRTFGGMNPETFLPDYDTLVFENCYNFINKKDFLPLQLKGFMVPEDTLTDSLIDSEKPDWLRDYEWGKTSNGNFSTEIHNTFTYKGGEILVMGGDDDIYTFIDGKAVFNAPWWGQKEEKVIYLDSLGLTKKESYNFELFHADRGVGGTGLVFVTNIDFDKKGSGPDTTIQVVPVRKRRSLSLARAKNSIRLHLGVTTLAIPRASASVEIRLFNMAGKAVFTSTLKDLTNSASVSLDMAGMLATGPYLVTANCLNEKGQEVATVARTFMVMR